MVLAHLPFAGERAYTDTGTHTQALAGIHVRWHTQGEAITQPQCNGVSWARVLWPNNNAEEHGRGAVGVLPLRTDNCREMPDQAETRIVVRSWPAQLEEVSIIAMNDGMKSEQCNGQGA